eukprot:2499328-Amphidinium_carterae.2
MPAGPADPQNLGATWPAVLDAFNYMEAGGTKAYFFRKATWAVCNSLQLLCIWNVQASCAKHPHSCSAYEKRYGMEAPVTSNRGELRESCM